MVFGSGKTYAMITARRQDGCHAKPGHDITRYHQCWSGTDPNTLPAKHITSKAEYTNTQQGLPVSWYT
jgi:hypothetical protein